MEKRAERPLAVVTGASNGIGYELARQFAKNGFDLFIVADSGKITKAAETLRPLGMEIRTAQIDLATYQGVEELFSTIRAYNRPVTAVAINAGVGVGGRFIETPLESELNLINLNVTSTVHLAKRIVQYMIDCNEGGKILFTSSIAATMPGPYEAVYAASKAFIFSFAEALRYELKEQGISITALLPGPTDTNFFHRAGMDDTKVGAEEKDDPAQVAEQGFRALMDGKDHIIAGSLKTRLQNAANDLIPETTKAKMHASLAKPGSAANR